LLDFHLILCYTIGRLFKNFTGIALLPSDRGAQRGRRERRDERKGKRVSTEDCGK